MRTNPAALLRSAIRRLCSANSITSFSVIHDDCRHKSFEVVFEEASLVRHDCPLTPRSIGGRPSSQRLTRASHPGRGGVMRKRSDWSRPLPRPIVIPQAMKLATLADVRALIEKHLPAECRTR